MNKNTKENAKVVLAVVAHPDDAEFLCAGTLAQLRKQDWEVVIATMTAGDCGTRELSSEKISKIRRKEAAEAAKLLNADYHCLECKDAFIMYDRPTLLKAIKLVRGVKPDVVFAMSPTCYMIDHEITSNIIQTATFTAGMINIKTGDVPPYFRVPHLYYMDPIEGKNKFGEEIEPGIVVDISSVIDIKEEMLRCHDSQRTWLLQHHGMDKYLETMKQLSAKRGRKVGVEYGEGFRQHLGHGYPQDNILLEELGKAIYAI